MREREDNKVLDVVGMGIFESTFELNLRTSRIGSMEIETRNVQNRKALPYKPNEDSLRKEVQLMVLQSLQNAKLTEIQVSRNKIGIMGQPNKYWMRVRKV